MNANIAHRVEDIVKELVSLRTQINFETEKDEELRHMIIESRSCVTDAIQNLTVAAAYLKAKDRSYGKKPTEKQSDGCLKPVIWTL